MNKHQMLNEEDLTLMEKIKDVRESLECINNVFNNITDHTLIDSCVYEMNSLNMKYSFYLQECKSKGIVKA